MATVVDPGAGSLAQGVAALLTGASRGINEESIRAEKIRSNPELLMRLAPAARRANEAGALPQFLKSLGLSPDNPLGAQLVEGIPAGAEELTETAFVAAEGPSKQVDAAVSGFDVATAGNQAALDFGLPMQRVLTESLRLSSDTDYLNASREADLPQLRASAEAAGFQFDEKNARYQREGLILREEAGIPRLEVDREVVANRLATEQGELGLRALDAYDDYISNLPDTPLGRHLRNIATLSIANPGVVNHIGLHEQMDFRQASTMSAGSGDPNDMMLLYDRYQNNLHEAQDRLAEAESDEQKFAAMRDIANLRLLGEELINRGAMLPFELTGIEHSKAWLGLRDKFEMIGVSPELIDPLSLGAARVVAGDFTIEEMVASPTFQKLSEVNKAKVLAAVSPEVASHSGPRNQGTGPRRETPERGATVGSIANQLLHTEGMPAALGFQLSVAGNRIGHTFGRLLGSQGSSPATIQQIYSQLSDEAREGLDNYHADAPDRVDRGREARSSAGRGDSTLTATERQEARAILDERGVSGDAGKRALAAVGFSDEEINQILGD